MCGLEMIRHCKSERLAEKDDRASGSDGPQKLEGYRASLKG